MANSCFKNITFEFEFALGVVLHLTPLDSATTLEKWDYDAVLARLEQLRQKAPFVRVLIIVDERSGGPQHCLSRSSQNSLVRSRTPDRLPQLASTRTQASFRSRSGIGFWLYKWTISTSEIHHHPRTHNPTQAWTNLGQHTVQRFTHISTYVFVSRSSIFALTISSRLVHPKIMELTHPHYHSFPQFKPATRNSSRSTFNLSNLLHTVSDEWRLTLFDFTGIPQASIRIEFYL